VLITIFGAMNTIIAGVVAFLKSRGQPLRSRMFRDDLDRVVDEIESSAVMWLGISQGVHGYDAIDTDEQVTVRSEVARLTRLYDRAVKANTTNDPDLYAAGGPGDFHNAALRSRNGGSGIPVATPQPIDPPIQAPVIQPPVAVEPDESPATTEPTPVTTPKPVESQEPVAEMTAPSAPRVEQPPSADESSVPIADPTPVPDSTPAAPSEAPTANDEKLATISIPTTPATEQPDPDSSPATAARLPPRDKAKTDKLLEKTAKLSRLDDLRRTQSDI
jgi:hypothetical protein